MRIKKPARPLQFGSDFHKLLELRKDKSALVAALRDIKETYYNMPSSWQSDLGNDYIEDIKAIFSDYQKRYKGFTEPTETEKKIDFKFGEYKGEPLEFVGIIDEMYFKKRKEISISDHKTFTNKPDMNTLVMNTQANLYSKAVQNLYGVLPRTVIWDYIKSTPASEPIWLEKSKKFSEAKSSTITPQSWRRACKRKKITDEETLSKAAKYEGNIPNFFFRVELSIIPEAVEDTWEGFTYTARDIARQGHKNKTKNMTMNCKWCSYRDICNSELTGGDTKYIIDKDYELKEESSEEETNGVS